MKEHEGCENCEHYVPIDGYQGVCNLDTAHPKKREWRNWCRFWKYGYIPPPEPHRTYPIDCGRKPHWHSYHIVDEKGKIIGRKDLKNE